MKDKPEVLLVEDDSSLIMLYQQYLKNEPINLSVASTGNAAKDLIKNLPPALVLLDLKLPDIDGREILEWIREQDFPTNVIVMTGHSSVDIAVDIMQLGADDFLEKPVDASRLKMTIKNSLEQARLKHLVEDFQNTFERDHYHNFIGMSLAMQAVYQIIDAAAPSSASVFITGESGTGKEVCAEAIHKQSARAVKPFIALNCGAIPHELMESEVFGHIKGAFTGASADRNGAASQADGGTLFLDELGEMDMELQTKLLRFIQTGKFQKVGGNKEESVDIRFICATNRDPLEAINNGKLREDLYYRLHVVPIHLPPLRERGDDILSIAMHFLKTFAKEDNKNFTGFSPEVEVILRQYNWPGNVRQLQNVIRNITVLHDDNNVNCNHLPAPLDNALSNTDISKIITTNSSDSEESSSSNKIKPLAQVEQEAIEHAIALCDDNIPKAAALLEVSPSTILFL